ncbi:MAG: potassium-transporting ATPase subunit KdpA [Ignavibacteriales bacterium]|nr:potassium-transporting ATPase subunit KdpA [Ignavibacteriales bacterium]
MSTEILGIVFSFLITVIIAIPMGKYMSRVFKGERVWTDFLIPIENFIFKISAVDLNEKMDWKKNIKAMLLLNIIFYTWSFLILLLQGSIPLLNPAGIANMEPALTFNTAVSFLTNTNLQHYSGETGASYLSQMLVFTFLQFVSAATGIAALALLFKGLIQKQASDLGNFYNLFLKSCTRILLPLSLVVSVVLLLNGIPQTFEGAQKVITLQGDTVNVATGPVASMISIKQLGTNGGGYFGPNSAHPFENPNYFTNLVENFSILFIPIALVFTFGYYLNRKKLAWIFFSIMTILFISFVTINVSFETAGNPEISKLGVDQSLGSMEGKEVRFGAAASAYWSVSTTSTSNGSVNSMHDSQTPISGGVLLLDMMINALYGGVGVGFLNFFIYIIIAIFIAGLMVGRTPEFLGKKIEAREVKIAALVLLVTPFLVLIPTAISSYMAAKNPNIGWLNNPSYHGFSEMLYEFTSANANNGSGFEGLGDNVYFWNILTGIVMLLARFLPIIGPVAIGGLLAEKKYIPESAGTLKAESYTFAAMVLGIIIIVSALNFFPALALGPLAEFFSM